jgi:glucose/arabinose dehydrogenase
VSGLIRTRNLRALACAVVFLAACEQPRTGGGDASPEGGASVRDDAARDAAAGYRVETVISNLEVPWSIVFAPDGRMLFTERPGRVRVFESGKLKARPLAVISDVERGARAV